MPVGTCKPGWHWAGRCLEERASSKVKPGVLPCLLPALGASSFQELMTLHPGRAGSTKFTEPALSHSNKEHRAVSRTPSASPWAPPTPGLRAFLRHLLVSALTNFNPQVSGRAHLDPLTQLTLQSQPCFNWSSVHLRECCLTLPPTPGSRETCPINITIKA